jgi:hypothetical protein
MDSNESNPISAPAFSIFKRLSALNGLVSLLDNQLKNFSEFSATSFQEQKINLSQFIAGYALIIGDLTTPPEHRYIKYFSAGRLTLDGNAYVNAADELVSHWSAWTVAQCFEAFETFLKDINA